MDRFGWVRKGWTIDEDKIAGSHWRHGEAAALSLRSHPSHGVSREVFSNSMLHLSLLVLPGKHFNLSVQGNTGRLVIVAHTQWHGLSNVTLESGQVYWQQFMANGEQVYKTGIRRWFSIFFVLYNNGMWYLLVLVVSNINRYARGAMLTMSVGHFDRGIWGRYPRIILWRTPRGTTRSPDVEIEQLTQALVV